METNQNINAYKKIRKIGKGGCGVVFLVQKNNKNYALKKISDLTKNEIDYYQKILNVLFKINNDYIMNHFWKMIA